MASAVDSQDVHFAVLSGHGWGGDWLRKLTCSDGHRKYKRALAANAGLSDSVASNEAGSWATR